MIERAGVIRRGPNPPAPARPPGPRPMGDSDIWSLDRPVCRKDLERDRASIAREARTLIKRQSREIAASRDRDRESGWLLEDEIEPGRFASIRSR